MRNKGLVTLLCSIYLTLFFIVLSFTGGSPEAFAQAPIKLKLISMYPKDALWTSFPLKWMEKVNQAAAGKLEITFIGGPEVVSPFQALDPVEKGTFDMVSGTPAFHIAKVPDGILSGLTMASLLDQRKAGLVELIDKKYRQKANVTVIGFGAGGTKCGTLTKKRVTKLDDFKALRIRAVPTWIPPIKAIGASAVIISIPETYSALEKGIVDGVMMPIDRTIYENGWYEVLKYIILPLVRFQTVDFIWMNASRFDALPKEYQKLFVETIKAMEPEIYAYYSKATEEEIKRAVSKGLEIIQLSPDVAKEYYDRTTQAFWSSFSEKAPDIAAEVSKLFPR